MANREARAPLAALLFPFTHWNWKVALLTALLRGSACVLALRHMELHARRHFGIVEAAFVLLTCGFFSALQQQSLLFIGEAPQPSLGNPGRQRRRLPRQALAWLACVVVVPLTSLGCDAGLHFWLDGRQTRQLGPAALLFTLLSATLHWHMIRNGALLIGDHAHTLSTDLKRIPRLLASYFASPVLFLGKLLTAAKSAPARPSTTLEDRAAA